MPLLSFEGTIISSILSSHLWFINLCPWYWWVSELIPRFTKIFEYLKNLGVIVFGIKKSTIIRNLSPWARSRAEKSHQVFSKFRLGQVCVGFSKFSCHLKRHGERRDELTFPSGVIALPYLTEIGLTQPLVSFTIRLKGIFLK